MQYVGNNYVAFRCSLTAAVTLSQWPNELSPTNDKDAELNKQILFGIDLNETSWEQRGRKA